MASPKSDPRRARRRRAAQRESGASVQPAVGALTVTVLVEIPKGSRNKYELDPASGRFRLDRMLFSSVQYPADYGFIVDTLAEDGDPLDAMVVLWEPTFPGCLIEARPLGLFEMWDEKGPDAKILCAPAYDPYWGGLESLDDVPAHLLEEIRHFFGIYKDLEPKKTGVGGWQDRDAAVRAIREARERFSTADG